MNDRLKYLLRCLRGAVHRDRYCCPNCNEQRSELVRRKYLVTSLRRCRNCRLLFRVPTDPPGFGAEFYQLEYDGGFATDCPDPPRLQQLLDQGFRRTPKDFSSRVAVLQALGVAPGSRLLDYGASWGYATWQFNQAGYRATGFELSRPRARYARERLGVDVRDSIEALEGPFDAFFSCHVLEHVPQISQVFALAERLLRPGGVFVAITPNGCPESMAAEPGAYHRAWGSVHPQHMDAEFYRHAFGPRPLCLASSPFDLPSLSQWRQSGVYCGDLSGSELLLAVVPQPVAAEPVH